MPVITRFAYSNGATLPCAWWSLAIVTVSAAASERSNLAFQSPAANSTLTRENSAGGNAQDHVGLAAEPAHFLEAQDVGAARRRAVRRHRTRRHEPRLDRFRTHGSSTARKPWCGSLGLIDHATGEHEHRRDREYARDHVAVKIQRMRQQLRLSAWSSGRRTVWPASFAD